MLVDPSSQACSIGLTTSSGECLVASWAMALVRFLKKFSELPTPHMAAYLISVVIFAWIFINSDVQELDDVIVVPDEANPSDLHDLYTPLAKNLWFDWSACALETLFLYVFALVCGDGRDHEAMSYVSIGYTVGVWLERIHASQAMTAGIEQVDAVMYLILILLGVAAIARYRWERRHGDGYEPIPTTS